MKLASKYHIMHNGYDQFSRGNSLKSTRQSLRLVFYFESYFFVLRFNAISMVIETIDEQIDFVCIKCDYSPNLIEMNSKYRPYYYSSLRVQIRAEKL